MSIVHIIVDTRNAMGANAVNSMAEALASKLSEWTGARTLLRILTNLADRRVVRARAVWPVEEIGGEEVRDNMLSAYHFADADPYRAATHNKGIMNGVSAVVPATGNDTRAIEVGVHAFAARDGRYRSMSRWKADSDGNLVGILEMSMAVGLIGGATKIHPTAQANLQILGVETADALARVIVAVGLAQNFGAMRALALTGIQKCHMALHAQNVALMVGAVGDEIDTVANELKALGKVRQDLAEEILARIRSRRNELRHPRRSRPARRPLGLVAADRDGGPHRSGGRSAQGGRQADGGGRLRLVDPRAEHGRHRDRDGGRRLARATRRHGAGRQ